MAQQGHLIETVAIAELRTRRERLVAYQAHARYAVADSYDRASKAQALSPNGATKAQADSFDRAQEPQDGALPGSGGSL